MGDLFVRLAGALDKLSVSFKVVDTVSGLGEVSTTVSNSILLVDDRLTSSFDGADLSTEISSTVVAKFSVLFRVFRFWF